MADRVCTFTYAVIFSIDVFEIVTRLALAVVASEGVDTLTVVWTLVLSRYTLINI